MRVLQESPERFRPQTDADRRRLRAVRDGAHVAAVPIGVDEEHGVPIMEGRLPDHHRERREDRGRGRRAARLVDLGDSGKQRGRTQASGAVPRCLGPLAPSPEHGGGDVPELLGMVCQAPFAVPDRGGPSLVPKPVAGPPCARVRRGGAFRGRFQERCRLLSERLHPQAVRRRVRQSDGDALRLLSQVNTMAFISGPSLRS